MKQQEQPLADSFRSRKLKEFVGPDSFTFFELYGVEPSFLGEPVKSWDSNTDFRALQGMVRETTVVNDCAERALGLLTEFNTGTVTKDETQRQALLQVVRHMRKQQKAASSSTERCTKATISAVNYSKV